MGPNTILDKSSFQGLSKRELFGFARMFRHNVVPILVEEIRGDLAKNFSKGKTAEGQVRALARKFGGSGGVVNMGFRRLLRRNLEGNEVPMTGQIIPDNWTEFISGDERGVLIDIGPTNHLIMRLAQGSSEYDQSVAKVWRAMVRGLSLRALEKHLAHGGIGLDKKRLRDDLAGTVDQVLDRPANQQVWAGYLCDELGAGLVGREAVGAALCDATLAEFAPYAHHCVRAELLLLAAERLGQVGKKPSNKLDLQYLFFLPFCQVFVSDDKLHRLLAPMLLRKDQSFFSAGEFKTSLAEQVDFWDEIAEPKATRLRRVLGSRAVPLAGNCVHLAWQRHARAWKPGDGNRAIELSPSEVERGEEEVRALFRAAAEATGRSDPQKGE